MSFVLEVDMSNGNHALAAIPGGIPLPPGVEAIQIGFKIAGVWHWNTVSPSPAPAQSLHERRSTLPAPRAANERRAAPAAPARKEAPAMTHGRDPHRFLFTFGKYRGQYVEDICATEDGRHELYDWLEFFQKEQARATRGVREPLLPAIEVALVMVEQALLDLHYEPKPKYTTPRRRP